MAGDLLRLLDTVEAQRAVLCGHSLGGKVAMAAALLAPSRVAHLLVVDIAPVVYSSSNKLWQANFTIMDAMHAMPGEVMADRKAADAALRDAGVPDAGVRAFLLQNLQPEKQSWRCNLRALRDAAYRGELAGFPEHLLPAPSTLPARFIAGRKSSYILREYEPAMRRFFPGAEEGGPHVVEAGHWLHAERPDEFVGLVDGFLHAHAGE
jgi:pimeloyl-ACP methyl ester carboxylesterase